MSSISPEAVSPEPGPPEAGPFSADGGPTGVLVLHGFTGSPRTVRPWAERLAEAGLTVRAPLLSGHGGDWQALARTGWTDWYADAERAFTELYARCDRVFVAGISMGGCLAFRLAETQGERVSGVVVVNPSLTGDNRLIPFTPVLKYVVRAIPSIGGDIKNPGAQEGASKKTPVASVATLPAMWRTTVAELASVTQPVLVYRSTVDHVVGPASMKVLTAALPGAEVRMLENSYHVATLDNDAPEIFDGTLAFIQKHSIRQQNG
ncbi:MAG TPA: alpha/beta fold hydrolase [Trebonia sp.]|nr:alpha/beta fold hydrolase [Trebonia sp.]